MSGHKPISHNSTIIDSNSNLTAFQNPDQDSPEGNSTINTKFDMNNLAGCSPLLRESGYFWDFRRGRRRDSRLTDLNSRGQDLKERQEATITNTLPDETLWE